MSQTGERIYSASQRALRKARGRSPELKVRYLKQKRNMGTIQGAEVTYEFKMEGSQGNTWVYSCPYTVGGKAVHITLELDRTPTKLHFTVEDEPALEQMHVWFEDGQCTGDNCGPDRVRQSALPGARAWIDDNLSTLQAIAQDFTAGVQAIVPS